jgi:hypothetical protein
MQFKLKVTTSISDKVWTTENYVLYHILFKFLDYCTL